MSLATDLFDYALPAHLVAQTPAERRDQSRLLVVHRATRTLEHRVFSELPTLLAPGDSLVRNIAAVLPARLFAQRPSGGRVECLLLHPTPDPDTWWCLLRPGKKLPVGATFGMDGAFTATVLAKGEEGTARVRFAVTPPHDSIVGVAQEHGQMPLPPYIERTSPGEPAAALDRERYQTVYADRAHPVAVAAPTAGLHFTPELLARLQERGLHLADVTLHVGLGTFRPIATSFIEEHRIHRELCEVPVATQRLLLAPPGRRVAVGTTAVRTIESFLAGHSEPLSRPWRAETQLFLYPPATFRGTDALITNFHQPRSTLLCLVAAFLTPGSPEGIAWIREIYREAIAREYRFFSYGDAMLVL